MPGMDGTGPFGDGRPGRGLGPCGRFGTPAGERFGIRRGRGFRRGFGRGYGFHGGYGPRWAYRYDGPGYLPQDTAYEYTKEEMLAMKEDLQSQLQWLNDQLSKDDKA